METARVSLETAHFSLETALFSLETALFTMNRWWDMYAGITRSTRDQLDDMVVVKNVYPGK